MSQLALQLEADVAPEIVDCPDGRRFVCRALTHEEALEHPWWGQACPGCDALAGEPCKGARKPRPDGPCRHRATDGAPFCCLHGKRTDPTLGGNGYRDPRYIESEDQ